MHHDQVEFISGMQGHFKRNTIHIIQHINSTKEKNNNLTSKKAFFKIRQLIMLKIHNQFNFLKTYFREKGEREIETTIDVREKH